MSRLRQAGEDERRQLRTRGWKEVEPGVWRRRYEGGGRKVTALLVAEDIAWQWSMLARKYPRGASQDLWVAVEAAEHAAERLIGVRP